MTRKKKGTKLALLLDLETTGLLLPEEANSNLQPKIIEVGCALMNGSCEEVEAYSQIINPGRPIDSTITKITGLTNEQIAKEGIVFSRAIAPIRELFARAHVLIAHNLPFDKTVLEYELWRHKEENWPWPPVLFCTAQEYTHEFGYAPKLIHLYERKVGKPLAQTHRALDDVRAMAEALKADGALEALLS